MTGFVLTPALGWQRGPHEDMLSSGRRGRSESDKDQMDARSRRWMAKVEHQDLMRRVLGTPIFMHCTTLLGLPSGPIGPARMDSGGLPLVWSLWAPQRRVLVDVYGDSLPPEEELMFRQAFADDNQLKYAVVEPGYELTLDALEELVQ